MAEQRLGVVEHAAVGETEWRAELIQQLMRTSALRKLVNWWYSNGENGDRSATAKPWSCRSVTCPNYITSLRLHAAITPSNYFSQQS